MTGPALLLLSLTAVVAVVDWIVVSRGLRVVEYVCKPLVMVGLIATALALDPSSDLARGLLVVGLALSLLGDVCLMLPSDLFVAGLSAFLAAHLLYIAAMLVLGVHLEGLLVGVLLMAVVGLLVARRIVLGARATAPVLTGPVTAYVVVLSVMVVVAIGTGRPAAIVGALLFAASDSVLGWTRFVVDLPRGRVIVMVTYHLAQIGLVLALI